MEAASISETSISYKQTTRRNIPEDSYVHTRRREILKSHIHVDDVNDETSLNKAGK
jgi:hypothetical protein